jgi:cell division septation protein DedD
MTQDGEKELVLGNKQLIGLFFVVVALCGVFFAMGYMIGRNTSKTTTLEAAAQPNPASPVQQETEPPRETTQDETQQASPTPLETQPAQPSPVVTPPPSTQTQAAHDTPAPAVSAAAPPPEPEAGATWLQVTALQRNDADKLVRTLKEQNFPAQLASSSKPDLYRVLVGPYHQTADVADAKARLKALGFANAFVQR